MSQSDTGTPQPTAGTVLSLSSRVAAQTPVPEGLESISPRRWWLIAVIVLGTVSSALSFWGFLELNAGSVLWARLLDAGWRTLGLFFTVYLGPEELADTPLSLVIGRLGILVTLATLSWKAITALLGERLTALRLRLNPPDVVILGLTPDSLRIGAALAGGQRVALVTEDDAAPLADAFRRQVGRLLVAGDPAAASVLSKVRLAHCRHAVYVAGDRDDRSLEILGAVHSVLAVAGALAPELRLLPILEDKHRLERAAAAVGDSGLGPRILALDPAMGAARRLLWQLPPDWLAPDDTPISVLILGASPVAERLILQLARAVYPRRALTRVVVVDPYVAAFRQDILIRYPVLDPEFPDRELFPGLHPVLDLAFVTADPVQLPAATLDQLQADRPFHVAYVHLPGDHQTARAVSRLRQLQVRQDQDWPVGAYFQRPPPGHRASAAVAAADVFLPLKGEKFLGQWLEQTAALMHAVDRSAAGLRALVADPPRTETQRAAWRRTALERWAAEPEWKRESNRMVAEHLPVKLRACSAGWALQDLPLDGARGAALEALLCRPDNLARLAELEHRRYCVERMLAGWLPVSGPLWNRYALGIGTEDQGANQVHRDRLRAHRLNHTLKAAVGASDEEKDREQVRATCAALLYLEAGPPMPAAPESSGA